MFKRATRAALPAAFICLLASCAKSPVTPTGTVTVTAPIMAAPANGALIANLNQPVTLIVTNGVVTDASGRVFSRFHAACQSRAARADRALLARDRHRSGLRHYRRAEPRAELRHSGAHAAERDRGAARGHVVAWTAAAGNERAGPPRSGLGSPLEAVI